MFTTKRRRSTTRIPPTLRALMQYISGNKPSEMFARRVEQAVAAADLLLARGEFDDCLQAISEVEDLAEKGHPRITKQLREIDEELLSDSALAFGEAGLFLGMALAFRLLRGEAE